MLPNIPPIPADLREPVAALVRSGAYLEGLVALLAEGEPFEAVLARPGQAEAMEAASRCIAAWRERLGIDR